MVTQRLDNLDHSKESEQILNLIEEGKSFLLSGGAGSGKTFTLIEIIRELLTRCCTSNIACITYTNAAADEIGERISHQNLSISTIHEFLWSNIKYYQSELKETIIELILDEDERGIHLPDGTIPKPDYFKYLEKGIQYREYVKLSEGIISHDELIIIAHKMYENYPKLRSITIDKYPYIFVDEYQDTDPLVIDILLNFLKNYNKDNVVGFFGDAMQSIYDGSVGDLNDYLNSIPKSVHEVKKEQNRRNPQLVINLANKLRSDALTQHPSDDDNAPNMENGVVKSGTIKFIYSDDDDLNQVREYLGWDFSNNLETKELNLTHNLISQKAGFDELMRIYDRDHNLSFVRRVKDYIRKNDIQIDTKGKTFEQVLDELHDRVSPTHTQQRYIDQFPNEYASVLKSHYDYISNIYVNKDQLIDDKKNTSDEEDRPGNKRDNLIKHLFKIQRNLWLYSNKKYNDFIRTTDFRIQSLAQKVELKENIEQLLMDETLCIGDVIDQADKAGIVSIDDKLSEFIENKKYIYQQVANLPYQQFKNLYNYIDGHTPFSTQHKTKGSEFKNIFVILDNGQWNNYNFNYLFTNNGTESVLKRTQKIFYVCCTRAKDNLAVFYHRPPYEVVSKAIEWFGEDNVIKL